MFCYKSDCERLLEDQQVLKLLNTMYIVSMRRPTLWFPVRNGIFSFVRVITTGAQACDKPHLQYKDPAHRIPTAIKAIAVENFAHKSIFMISYPKSYQWASDIV